MSEIPKEIWLDIIPAETTPRVLAAINMMKWVFVTCPKDVVLLSGLSADLTPGQVVPVGLVFQHAGRVEVNAEVVASPTIASDP